MKDSLIVPIGADLSPFIPCDVETIHAEKSVKLHPAVLAIRNKRRRWRMVSRFHRIGIRVFAVTAWRITPH